MCVCVLGNNFMALTCSKSVRIAISKVLIKISQLSLMSFVYLSKCHPVAPFCCFTERSNLSTQTQGFCMLAHSARGPGE